MSKYLVISTSNELVRVMPDRVVHISSDGNYSTMVLSNKEEHLFCHNLSCFQKIIEQQLKSDARTFIRIGKSLIINKKYISYINISKQQLILSDCGFNNVFNLTASKEALKELKKIFEENQNE